LQPAKLSLVATPAASLPAFERLLRDNTYPPAFGSHQFRIERSSSGHLIKKSFTGVITPQNIVKSKWRLDDECILSVVDEGPGVLPEDLPKLFSPFFTTKPNGSGLGLSAGRKVLREQGGDLYFTPVPSGGAKFSIIVPRENTEYNLEEYLLSQKLARQDI